MSLGILAPRALLVGCAIVFVAGCGNSRTPVPSAAQPSRPPGLTTLTLPRAGVRIDVPRNWSIVEQRAPLLVTVVSGGAVQDTVFSPLRRSLTLLTRTGA